MLWLSAVGIATARSRLLKGFADWTFQSWALRPSMYGGKSVREERTWTWLKFALLPPTEHFSPSIQHTLTNNDTVHSSWKQQTCSHAQVKSAARITAHRPRPGRVSWMLRRCRISGQRHTRTSTHLRIRRVNTAPSIPLGQQLRP